MRELRELKSLIQGRGLYEASNNYSACQGHEEIVGTPVLYVALTKEVEELGNQDFLVLSGGAAAFAKANPSKLGDLRITQEEGEPWGLQAPPSRKEALKGAEISYD